MKRWSTTVALITALLAAGCGGRGASNPFEAGPNGARTIRIQFRNFNFADVTVFALRGSERVRLGIVTGKSDRNFDVEWTVVLPLQVQYNVLAGVRCATPPMTVEPGETVYVQVEVDLSNNPNCSRISTPAFD